MPMKIPPIGLGTWGLGGKYERDESNREASIKSLKLGLKIGYRLIDTAELYGRGLAEEIVGQAIKSFKREEIFIISKVWLDNLAYDAVINSVKKSLARMETDYIDLYLIHWSKENRPKKNVPLEETVGAMEFLADQKLIKYIGVSNADVNTLRQVQKALKHTKLAADQIEYNFYDKSASKDIVPYCRRHDIKLIAYRPLTKGNLDWAKNQIICSLSKKYNKTSVQIVLNWLICLDLSPIPKASSEDHLLENYGALGWELETSDVALINNITQ
ncbi:MAG: Aldo/keto reductase [Parcubacteria group bacterium GW2011_GWC2_42_12]|nr:MAG: Aldo/keto reductase [Parcubacteria group bacterium GW2011_GWC2_42_12]